MKYEKEYFKQGNKCMIVAHNKVMTLSHLEKLFRIAKNDFPKITSNDVEFIFMNNGVHGIKFYPAQEEQPVA